MADSAHAWRVGMTPERYAALEGEERDRVHREVKGQLRDDRAAFGAIPDRPAGAVGGLEEIAAACRGCITLAVSAALRSPPGVSR